MTSHGASSLGLFTQDDPWYDYVKNQSLTVDVLWEVAYGVFREALCLDSLEDFNTTKADLVELKDNILTTWKSRDRCKTSSLRPTFIPSSVRASEKKKSTLGDTFSPSSATAPTPICSSIFSGLSYALGGTQSPLIKPIGPPPGIPYPLVSMPYRQGAFPTPSYSSWGSTTGYNFDPMMGKPLRPVIPISYPFLSQSSEMLLSTSLCPSLADLPSLLDEDDEESSPLVVEPPAHSSHIVTGGAVPTVTISMSGAETTPSASPRLSPQDKHLYCQHSKPGCAKGNPRVTVHLSEHSFGKGWSQVRPGDS